MSRALIVGIDDYPSCPLQSCVRDAKAVAGLLASNADGAHNFDIWLETTPIGKGKLKKNIKEFFEAEDAVSLFYFAGHGFLNEYGGYIVTPDYNNYDEGISMTEILGIVNNSKAIDKIVILDCCHSGYLGSEPDINSAIVHIGKGVTILTASGPHEAAAEVNGHGVFTNLLLAALNGGAADLRGEITPGSIYAYIDLAMGPFGQRPSLKSNITKFVSLRTVEPPIPLETLRKLSDYFAAAIVSRLFGNINVFLGNLLCSVILVSIIALLSIACMIHRKKQQGFKVYLSFSELRTPLLAQYIKNYLKPSFWFFNIEYYDFREHKRFHFLNELAICEEIHKNLADSDIFVRFIGEDLQPNEVRLVSDEWNDLRFNPFTRELSGTPDYAKYEVDISYDKFGFSNPHNRFQIAELSGRVAPMKHIKSILINPDESALDFAFRIINELTHGCREQQYWKRSALFWRMRDQIMNQSKGEET